MAVNAVGVGVSADLMKLASTFDVTPLIQCIELQLLAGNGVESLLLEFPSWRLSSDCRITSKLTGRAVKGVNVRFPTTRTGSPNTATIKIARIKHREKRMSKGLSKEWKG